jgi:hypothetical protein
MSNLLYFVNFFTFNLHVNLLFKTIQNIQLLFVEFKDIFKVCNQSKRPCAIKLSNNFVT